MSNSGLACPRALMGTPAARWVWAARLRWAAFRFTRSEEHTSELQSLTNLVCRLLLEKKKPQRRTIIAFQQGESGRRCLRLRRPIGPHGRGPDVRRHQRVASLLFAK